MIKTNKGKLTFKGSIPEILTDYSIVTKSLVKMLMENGCSVEDAKNIVAESHRVGTLTEEEVDLEVKDALWNVLERAQEELRKESVEENE